MCTYVHTDKNTRTCTRTRTRTHTHNIVYIPSGAVYSFQPLPEVGRGLEASAGAAAAGVAAGAEVEEEEASISGGLVHTDCRVTFFFYCIVVVGASV